jgi:hypothetical protein
MKSFLVSQIKLIRKHKYRIQVNKYNDYFDYQLATQKNLLLLKLFEYSIFFYIMLPIVYYIK